MNSGNLYLLETIKTIQVKKCHRMNVSVSLKFTFFKYMCCQSEHLPKIHMLKHNSHYSDIKEGDD